MRRLHKDGSIELGGAASHGRARRPWSRSAVRASSTPWTTSGGPNRDARSISPSSIPKPKSPCCAADWSTSEIPAALFSSGINLTLLYHGKIPYLFYIDHPLGFEHKIFRGLARPDVRPTIPAGATAEKPWIAAVDAFAIGGGCQHLLVMDYVLAANDAYMTLPARKEGIIPGASNMRLPRFVGDRVARQAIMYGRRLDCDSPEGRMICDEVVPPERMDGRSPP